MTSSRLTIGQRFFIVDATTREIEDILARLNPDEEWYVGNSQHEIAEMRLEMLVDLRAKMLDTLKARGTALHYLAGDNKPRFRSKSLAEKFKKPTESPITYQQRQGPEWVEPGRGES